ncbi:MAG: ATP-binding protein [Planctomycetota bacterium]|nr:ATP-binding protein [Planctomycetota bacterium]
MRQSQKLEAVGQLAGGVAHDFNNLLTIINGRCQLALARMPPADPARKELEIVLQTGERAVSLTRQLLAFSRKQMLDPKVLNLNDLVQHLQQMLVRLLGEDVELRTKLAPDLWAAKVDPSQVDQIVMNLAVNARDAMPHGGGLVIETQNTVLDEAYASKHPAVKPGEYVMLSVSDTGCGMDEETKARIFEPFFTTKEMGRGTGLGLSTVYGIVKQSSGHIWVYSVPGQGTVFKIYLPRARGEKVEAESSEEARLKSVAGAETIMVVEDEDEIRELLNQVLASHGYKVLLAENGLKALDLAAAHSGEIHLLLADVVMPKLSGRELADRFMLTRPGTRLLFMSGFTDDALANRGVLGEDAAFLEKPFSIDLLALKVRQVLDAGKPDAPQEPPSSAT